MNIVYVVNDAYGQGGVARILSFKTSYFIREYGYNITIISSKSADTTFYSYDENILIKHIPFQKKIAGLSYLKKLKKEINNINPDSVVICDNGVKGHLACFLNFNAPIVFESHSIDLIPFPKKRFLGLNIKRLFLKILVQHSLRQAAKVVVLSADHAKLIFQKKADIIPNPLWFESDEIADFKSTKVVAVGRLIESKGYARMIAIWKEIHHAYPKWTLDIYGEGNHRRTLKSLIKASGLEGSVKLCDHNTKIHELLPQYTLIIHTSYYESFSLVLMEAMACGLPAVAFDCPVGPRQIITNGHDGFLIEDFDEADFVRKVKMILSNDMLRVQLGRSAHESMKKFNQKKIMKAWNAVFLALESDQHFTK